jgi:hypothetical protein
MTEGDQIVIDLVNFDLKELRKLPTNKARTKISSWIKEAKKHNLASGNLIAVFLNEAEIQKLLTDLYNNVRSADYIYKKLDMLSREGKLETMR